MTDDDLRIMAQLADDEIARWLVRRGHIDLARRYLNAKDGEAIQVSEEELDLVRSWRRPYTTIMEKTVLVKETTL